MNYEAVFNIFLGMLAVLGCVLVIMFWIVFRKENMTHPSYRPGASLANSDCNGADRTIVNHTGLERS
jgi:hypothetical protein